MTGAIWEVIGGKKDGILVRTGKSIKSDEAETRLECHSYIEELELDGDRLHYQLLSGSGPDTGWVSLKMKGQDLVAPGKMVIKKDEQEKALAGSAPTPKEWPTDFAERLRAVAELRLAFEDSAPALLAMGDVALRFVVDDYGAVQAVQLEVKGSAVTVRQAAEDDKPDYTLTTRSSTLLKLWQGILDVQTSVGSGKLFIHPSVGDDKIGQLSRLVTSLLVLEGTASLPADGVRRPVPFERGGQLPPPPLPKTEEAATAPDWLIPDGIPEKKRRMLFLSIPWSGHIVHLKRIAEWFSEHPQYDVHFACMTETAPDLAEGIKVYTASPIEMTDIFDVMQERMRQGAMIRPEGAAADEDEEAPAVPQGVTSAEDSLKDSTALIKENSHKLMLFLMRVLLTVKPHVMVSDSCYSMGNLNKFGALFGGARTIFVNSPGIKEERMVPSDLEPPAEWVMEQFRRLQAEGKHEDQPPKEDQEGPTMVEETAGDFFAGEPPTPEEFMASGGKLPVERVAPKFRPLFDIPGFNWMTLMRLGDMLAKENPALNPINVFPSSSWMIEQKPEGQEYFCCPMLPLPIPIAGKLQVGRSALRNCLNADLLDWLFSEEAKDPVVYVAFGTIVKGFKGIIRRLAQALDGGSWRVLWALPKDLQAFLPDNLPKDRWRIEHFVNQKDVLRCERVKCFVSHCGMNSTMEAMASGVPMVCHPFFMDQYEWARTVRSHLRAGIEVHKFDSDANAIRGAIREVLEDPSFKANAMAVARRLRAQYERLKQLLGPAMSPKANLGPGATMIASYILCLLKGKDPSFLYDMVHLPA